MTPLVRNWPLPKGNPKYELKPKPFPVPGKQPKPEKQGRPKKVEPGRMIGVLGTNGGIGAMEEGGSPGYQAALGAGVAGCATDLTNGLEEEAERNP